jgi:hypothetical protein
VNRLIPDTREGAHLTTCPGTSPSGSRGDGLDESDAGSSPNLRTRLPRFAEIPDLRRAGGRLTVRLRFTHPAARLPASISEN